MDMTLFRGCPALGQLFDRLCAPRVEGAIAA
jgi:hypothetical protein